ncbi:hypothetical protein HZH68_005880 [Vespula germanica]|uniref:Leucine-rich repeat-containing protein 27 n=1 Tax=Vespula germanica TaxID=30212 RepID=A0A834KIJ0_VESGE|nr:hypothetical protein HZH68_005880 [Vespula germanica]
MINITRELLEQYYGFHNESNNDRSLSIHQCVNNRNDYEKENIDEQTILNETEEIITRDVQSEKNHNEEESADLCTYNFCGLDKEEEKEDGIITSESHFANILNNEKTFDLHENNANMPYVSYDPEELCISELCPIPAEDLDTISDISSVITQDTPEHSNKEYTDLLPLPKKTSVYNSTFVDLSNAKLAVLPNNIMQHFSRIRMLYLENNALSEIPEELFPSLQNLEWLDIRNNQLKSLPKNIKSHSSLHTLLLQGNKIQVLPLELCMVPKLKNLQVARNPLTVPPENIVALGCSNILSFLKNEWNKLHPDEVGIIPVKEVKPKSLTVLSNGSINKKKSDILQVINCYSCSDISKKFNKMSMIEKRKAYKPNNRCNSKGTNLVRQKQLSWIDEITEMLNKEASVLQKMKNKIALQEWRDDKSSFSKSMEKATKRREDDIPFAIDNVDDLYVSKAENKLNDKKNLQRRNKAVFVSPTNINKKIIELLDSLTTINTDVITNMTPTSKQKFLNDTIKKICLLQKEIHHLQRHNITTMP